MFYSLTTEYKIKVHRWTEAEENGRISFPKVTQKIVTVCNPSFGRKVRKERVHENSIFFFSLERLYKSFKRNQFHWIYKVIWHGFTYISIRFYEKPMKRKPPFFLIRWWYIDTNQGNDDYCFPPFFSIPSMIPDTAWHEDKSVEAIQIKFIWYRSNIRRNHNIRKLKCINN